MPRRRTTDELGELIELCAHDSLLWCQTFFPQTFRQPPARFHRELWDVLEDRAHRYVAFSVFRGGAKTTILRAFTLKRIAFGISRTVLFVSSAQEHSKRSLEWLRVQVETNKHLSGVFGLAMGRKWTEEQIQIASSVFGTQATVIALGITGQTRGINVGDYRPDLIVVDDPLTDENVATAEQREKTRQLFFGALARSLAPATESPDAKMVLLQTVMHPEDLISQCIQDPSWATRVYSCLDENGESVWPERFPTADLRREKEAHIARGQLHLWLREMECRIVAPESAAFREDWLRYWEVLPEDLAWFIAIDPVPPPRENQPGDSDYEVISVVGVRGGEYYLAEYSVNRGHTPEWTLAELFRLVDHYRPIKVRVEGTAYQRTLKWIIEQEMRRRGRYFQVDAVADHRKKQHRIVQAFSGVASQGRFFIHRSHGSFASQFVSYPAVSHDDILDSVAMALDAAQSYQVFSAPELVMEPLPANWRYAP
jgi:predicted phage terminase large subunit-like protein